MVGCAAQRDRDVQQLQAWKEEVECRAVLDREPPGQQVLFRVEIVEFGLDAGVVLREPPEERDDLPQLIRLRPVLRVEDHAVLPLGPLKSMVARPGLCLWQEIRHDDRLVMRWQRAAVDGRDRGVVVLLEKQFHVQLALRVVKTLYMGDDLACDVGLFV